VVIDDLDIERVAIAELKTEARTAIDGHRPLAAPVSLQLMQPNASQIAQLIQVHRRIQRSEQFLSGAGFEPTKPETLPSS